MKEKKYKRVVRMSFDIAVPFSANCGLQNLATAVDGFIHNYKDKATGNVSGFNCQGDRIEDVSHVYGGEEMKALNKDYYDQYTAEVVNFRDGDMYWGLDNKTDGHQLICHQLILSCWDDQSEEIQDEYPCPLFDTLEAGINHCRLNGIDKVSVVDFKLSSGYTIVIKEI